MAPKSQFSQEEEMLLRDFGRNLSRKSSIIFYFHGLFISAVPIWLYIRIHQMDLVETPIPFVLVTLISMYLITIAYKNNKFELKHKLAQKREDPIAKEISERLSEKISKKEKDERILWRKNEIAEAESMQLSILYSNALFLVAMITISFFLLKSYSSLPNYVLSMIGASGLTALLSTGTKKG
ncbi:translocon-associated protein subunit gamma-like [Styela clava]|uniref:translocon-associated protein subunit gamma-like n=1 Tax=Styela clava TaxID=7725 RepID=UPI001939B7FE|nr:translocon-associated protein subunit gamma-like [Styela clava]